MPATHYFTLFDQNDFLKHLEAVISGELIDIDKLKQMTINQIEAYEAGWEILTDSGFPEQTWPLFEHGYQALPDVETIERKTSPTIYELGEWLFILLGANVRKSHSLDQDWPIIQEILQHTGWSSGDCDKLFEGMPLSTLLNKNERYHPFLEISDHIRSRNARTGWLQLDKIEMYYHELLSAKEFVYAFDLTLLNRINGDNPIIIEEHSKRIPEAYAKLLLTFKNAIEQKMSILSSLVIWR